jgi:plasmid stabilization system protein ParE
MPPKASVKGLRMRHAGAPALPALPLTLSVDGMAYRVDITERAERDLERIYLTIAADSSEQARVWFNGLERSVLSLDEHPARGAPIGATIPGGGELRHLLYGRKGRRYRVIYAIDQASSIVTVLHIRHGARDAFRPDEPEVY